MLESLFFIPSYYLSNMIPWKFRKDWFSTDLENWFRQFWKKKIFEKVKNNLAEMAKFYSTKILGKPTCLK
jgi:hypothetical protein